MKQFILFLLFANLCTTAFAQSDIPEEIYRWTEDDLVQRTWGKKITRDESFPEEWNKNSAVYLSWQHVYECAKSGPGTISISSLIHNRIKILDEAAVTNFSEIYASGDNNTSTFNKDKNFVGVKLIKPTGKTIKINTKGFIEDKNGNLKLAIPDLQKGDVLDYYIYSREDFKLNTMPSRYVISENFPVQSKYPIKNFDYTLKTDEDWSVGMYTGKEGSKIKETIPDKKERMFTFSVKETNIPSFESERWIYPFLEGKFIRNYVRFSRNNLDKKSTGNLNKKVTKSAYDKRLKAIAEQMAIAPIGKNQFNKYLASANKMTKLSKSEKLEEYIRFLRHYYYSNGFINARINNGRSPGNKAYYYDSIMKGARAIGYKFDVLALMPRRAGSVTEAITIDEVDFVLRIKDGDEHIYFYDGDPFAAYSNLPYQYEGTDAYALETGRSISKLIKTPTSSAEENSMLHESVINFDESDKSLLHAKTKVVLKGHQIDTYPYYLTDWCKAIWKENKKYDTKKYGDPLIAKKKEKLKFEKFHDDQKEFRLEQFKGFAKNHYYNEIEEIKNTKAILNEEIGGVQSLDISFDNQFKDLVKKIGPNYILKVGKMVGSQVSLDEEEKVRKSDINMDFARQYNYNIKINIPEGYEIQGLEELNEKVDNPDGSFVSNASVAKNVLEINFIKTYKTNSLPAENWNNVKAFLDPASSFQFKEVLLRKK